ncbi:hypothetical protein J2I47_09140 [Fibrella sp. HMF5335]|uniref:Uncharacterized protein n=1 Tax=Fibrella rubiginis TaxID=2817060 RepID=A0A939GHS6_9BACT|nr:hypothetical protein [Fibrella rubiginis]MBO0936707.1 hypothetical protein [Fibrella rubiginis]
MNQHQHVLWQSTHAAMAAAAAFVRKLLLLGGLCLLVQLGRAQTQPLTDSDKREIKRQALTRITKDFPLVINNLTLDINTEADIKSMILNSYLPNSLNQQLFVNDEVILEDDVDPSHTGATAKVDKPVRQYLSDLISFYPKNPDSDIPSFVVSNVRLTDVIAENSASARIDVYFDARFMGKHKSGRAYQTVNRVATLQATRVNKKWEIYIRQILFVRPGAGLAQTTAPLPATVTAAVVLPPVEVREPLVVYRQSDYEFNATIRSNKQALDVVKTESPRLPLGQYRYRDDGSYELDGNRIVFNDKSKATFTFTNRDRDLLGFARVEPVQPKSDTIRSLATKPAPPVVTPGYLPPAEGPQLRKIEPVSTTVASPAVAFDTPKVTKPEPAQPVLTKPEPPKPALVKPTPEPPKIVAEKPSESSKEADNKPVTTDPVVPKVVMEGPKQALPAIEKPLPPPALPAVEKPALAEATPVVAEPTPVTPDKPAPKLPKPIVQKPAALSVSPDVKKAISGEQRRMIAAMRLRGWLQVVGGLAALGGSYVAYSGIKKDYDAYQTRAGALIADYAIYRQLSQRPVPPGPETLSLTSYGSPTIYGVYGGGVIGLGLTVNGIRTLFRAGKMGKKK